MPIKGSNPRAVPALDSWRPPPNTTVRPVFNIQEKITVHFHTRVYIHTGHAQWRYCKWGSLKRGQQSPLAHQLGGLGELCKLPQWGPGRSPGDQQIFHILVCPERLSYATWGPWACVRPPPRPRGRGVLPPALPTCVFSQLSYARYVYCYH